MKIAKTSVELQYRADDSTVVLFVDGKFYASVAVTSPIPGADGMKVGALMGAIGGEYVDAIKNQH